MLLLDDGNALPENQDLYTLYTPYMCLEDHLDEYNLKFSIVQATVAGSATVSVIRTNLACTGLNEMIVWPALPAPSATGTLHFVPSIETCTR